MTRKSLVTRLYSIVCLVFFFVLMLAPSIPALAAENVELPTRAVEATQDVLPSQGKKQPRPKVDVRDGGPCSSSIPGYAFADGAWIVNENKNFAVCKKNKESNNNGEIFQRVRCKSRTENGISPVPKGYISGDGQSCLAQAEGEESV